MRAGWAVRAGLWLALALPSQPAILSLTLTPTHMFQVPDMVAAHKAALEKEVLLFSSPPAPLYTHTFQFPDMVAAHKAALEKEVRRYTRGHIVHPGLAHWREGGGPMAIEDIPGDWLVGWLIDRLVG